MSLAVGFEVSKRLQPFAVCFIVCRSGYELSTASAMLTCLWLCSPHQDGDGLSSQKLEAPNKPFFSLSCLGHVVLSHQ